MAAERFVRLRRGPALLTVLPYKDELLPLWRFATPAQTKVSATAIWRKFLEYGRAADFVGMDMARKYLQTVHAEPQVRQSRSGRKYASGTRRALPRTPDPEKAAAAEIFRAYWQRALRNRRYLELRRRHQLKAAGRTG